MSESIVDVINRRFISANSVSVERVHINLNEWNALRQQLEQAEQSCRARIKADRLYCMKHGDEVSKEIAEENERVRQANLDVMMHFEDMKAEKERLEARCAELEGLIYHKCEPFILRKQAEAVELLIDGMDRTPGAGLWGLEEFKQHAHQYAQRLRTQDNEQENNQ